MDAMLGFLLFGADSPLNTTHSTEIVSEAPLAPLPPSAPVEVEASVSEPPVPSQGVSEASLEVEASVSEPPVAPEGVSEGGVEQALDETVELAVEPDSVTPVGAVCNEMTYNGYTWCNTDSTLTPVDDGHGGVEFVDENGYVRARGNPGYDVNALPLDENGDYDLNGDGFPDGRVDLDNDPALNPEPAPPVTVIEDPDVVISVVDGETTFEVNE